jgi:hypothetical protein
MKGDGQIDPTMRPAPKDADVYRAKDVKVGMTVVVQDRAHRVSKADVDGDFIVIRYGTITEMFEHDDLLWVLR